MDALYVPVPHDFSRQAGLENELPPIGETPLQVRAQAGRIPSDPSPSYPIQGLGPQESNPHTATVEEFLRTGNLTLNPLEHAIALASPSLLGEVLEKIETAFGKETLYGTLNTPMGDTRKLPLFYAIEKDYSQMIPSLVEAGANPNAYDQRGYTPLTLAVFNGNLEAVNFLLLQPGIDVNTPNGSGWTPLNIAMAKINRLDKEMYNTLRFNMDVDASNREHREHYKAIADALLAARGIDVNQSNTEAAGEKAGARPLDFAVERVANSLEHPPDKSPTLDDDGEYIDQLCAAGAQAVYDPDCNFFEGKRFTASYLCELIDTEKFHRIEIFLTYGADLQQKDPQRGLTPLGFALQEGYLDMVRMFLQYPHHHKKSSMVNSIMDALSPILNRKDCNIAERILQERMDQGEHFNPQFLFDNRDTLFTCSTAVFRLLFPWGGGTVTAIKDYTNHYGEKIRLCLTERDGKGRLFLSLNKEELDALLPRHTHPDLTPEDHRFFGTLRELRKVIKLVAGQLQKKGKHLETFSPGAIYRLFPKEGPLVSPHTIPCMEALLHTITVGGEKHMGRVRPRLSGEVRQKLSTAFSAWTKAALPRKTNRGHGELLQESIPPYPVTMTPSDGNPDSPLIVLETPPSYSALADEKDPPGGMSHPTLTSLEPLVQAAAFRSHATNISKAQHKHRWNNEIKGKKRTAQPSKEHFLAYGLESLEVLEVYLYHPHLSNKNPQEKEKRRREREQTIVQYAFRAVVGEELGPYSPMAIAGGLTVVIESWLHVNLPDTQKLETVHGFFKSLYGSALEKTMYPAAWRILSSWQYLAQWIDRLSEERQGEDSIHGAWRREQHEKITQQAGILRQHLKHHAPPNPV